MRTWKLGYEKAKKKALETYSSIGILQCPALGGEAVHFTRIGFSHLVRKGKNPRTRTEQKKRFVLVQHVTKILSNPDVAIEYRKEERVILVDRRGEKIVATSVAEFWTCVEKIEDCTVKVVVRQLDTGGPKHFFSVMGDNVTVTSGKPRNKKSRS